MIILEGCDGSGKSTLLEQLKERFQLPIHNRFCTSEDGPIPHLFREVYDDLRTWDDQPCSIFDRHSLISEYIYSLTTRDGDIDPQFLTGVASTMLTKFAESSLVIMCMPPFENVKENAIQEKQMDGVINNLYQTYQAYRLFYTVWPNQYRIRRYDYTQGPEELQQLFGFCNLHIADCNRRNS